jgi:hypothetical protein
MTEQERLQGSLDHWREVLKVSHRDEDVARFRSQAVADRITRLKRQAYNEGIEIR